MAVIIANRLDRHLALDKMLEPFLDVSTAAVLAATSSFGPNFAASIYKYQYTARFGSVMVLYGDQQASGFWKRQYTRATHYLRIVPGLSLLGLEIGKRMSLYLGDPPWNSFPRQINIWGDPIRAVWGPGLPLHWYLQRLPISEPPLPADVDIILWGGHILDEVTLYSPRFGTLYMDIPPFSLGFTVGMTLEQLLDGTGQEC